MFSQCYIPNKIKAFSNAERGMIWHWGSSCSLEKARERNGLNRILRVEWELCGRQRDSEVVVCKSYPRGLCMRQILEAFQELLHFSGRFR